MTAVVQGERRALQARRVTDGAAYRNGLGGSILVPNESVQVRGLRHVCLPNESKSMDSGTLFLNESTDESMDSLGTRWDVLAQMPPFVLFISDHDESPLIPHGQRTHHTC